MKPRHHPAELDKQARRALCEAILSLRDAAAIGVFLKDLTTPAELQALADRWRVVGLLKQDLPYREIAQRTGVSVTTTGRVARCLANPEGGYNLAWRALAGRKEQGEING